MADRHEAGQPCGGPGVSQPGSPQRSGNNRGKIAAVLLLAVLVAGSLWLARTLGHAGATQDCVATGRRDCG